MAHIQRLGHKGSYRYRVRYIDPAGKERSRTFPLKRDADDFLTSVSHRIRSGDYVDPDAGRVTVRDYAEAWRKRQLHRPDTEASYETRLRRHLYPYLGHRPLAALTAAEIEAWQAGLVRTMAPSTARGVRGALATILKSAVAERRIPRSPMDGVAVPKLERVLVRPISLDQVDVLEGELLDRYRAIVPLVAGSGLRAGEALGLTVDHLDLDRQRIDVVRQLKGRQRGGAPIFGPPKTRASVRRVPIAGVTADRLQEHVDRFPGAHGLIFTTGRGGAVTREVLGKSWRPARAAAGLGQDDGLHVLRHFYASMLIQGGASVKEVQARLGHATAMETLETYAHLWPDDEDRTRATVERMLGSRLRPSGVPGRPSEAVKWAESEGQVEHSRED